MTQGLYTLYGLELSYFTGKLEAYFRVKGAPYRFVSMTTGDFRRIAKLTGTAQMPQVQTPDGVWMTDTSAIIAHFEAHERRPNLTPSAPEAGFLSLLLEDYFDEWLWRPALTYRWAYPEDARLMSAQLARTMLADIPAPLWLRRRVILARQRREYLKMDGVTAATRPLVEALFLNTLDALEPIFSARPFLLGARPCQADFGLMGPVWRHFSYDPTPAMILRARAPQTLAWASRLWAMSPEEADAAPPILTPPEDLDPLLASVDGDYLPYLAANADAVASQSRWLEYDQGGVRWRVPASRYRLACLTALRRAFAALPEAARLTLSARLPQGAPILTAPSPPEDPQSRDAVGRRRPRDRLWRVGV